MDTSLDDGGMRKNYGYILIGIIIAFLLLIGKIWYLQIIKGGEFKQAAERNRIRNLRLPAPRGLMYDQEGRILVDNRPSYDVYYHPRRIRGKTKEQSRELRLAYLEKIGRELGVDFSLLKRRFNQVSGVKPIKIKTDISWEEVARINIISMSYNGEFPLSIEDETKRVYPFKELCAHFLGYVAEINDKQLEKPEYVGYRPGDFVGKVGIEEAYEDVLKGEFGQKEVELNARNVELRTLELAPAMPGNNLILNVDIDLVKAAARSMMNMAGAVVALDVKTGGLLCALSMPGYNPEIFSRVLTKEVWEGLLNDPKKPLANKAITNAYPPGSTWKVIPAIAALENGIITPSWVADCMGKWKYGDRYFRCWNERGHGLMNLHKAIVHSCDVYFYKLSIKVGIDLIGQYAKDFGAGALTGIDVTPETKGTVPTKEWKLETIGSPWIPGETLSCAIGQGYNLVSPMQLAVMYAAIANGGTVYKPRLVDRIEDPEGRVIKKFDPEVIRKLELKEKTLPVIRRALTGVVNAPGGTGHRAKLNKTLVAGKTGTAQVRRIKSTRIHISNMEYQSRDHAWFASFAPADDPEIAVVVLCEHSGHGGTAAAPVARNVLAKYFQKKDRAKPTAMVEDEEGNQDDANSQGGN